MKKNFRNLTIDDYDEMRRVWDIAGLSHRPNGRESRAMLGAEISRDHCAAVGVFDGEKMIGLTLVNYDGRRGWINRLAVDPDYRGLGLATELMQKAEEFLSQYGEVIVCGLIEDMNTPSMELFEKNGYTCLRSITYWSKRSRPDL